MTSLEDTEEEISDDTRRENGPSGTSNRSRSLESLDNQSEASMSRDVRSMKTTTPSRLPIYIRHHKVNNTHIGAR